MVEPTDAELIAAVEEERWLRGAQVGLLVVATVAFLGVIFLTSIVIAIAPTNPLLSGGLFAAMSAVVILSTGVGQVLLWRRRARRREGLPAPTAPRWPRWLIMAIGAGTWLAFMGDPPGRTAWLVLGATALMVAPVFTRRAEPEGPRNPVFPVVVFLPLMATLVFVGRTEPLLFLPAALPMIGAALWQRRQNRRAREEDDPDIALHDVLGCWQPPRVKGALLAQTGRWDRADIVADHLFAQDAVWAAAQGYWIRAARAEAEGRADDTRRQAALAIRLDPYHVDAWLLLAEHAIATERAGARELVGVGLRVAFRAMRTGEQVDRLQAWQTAHGGR